MGTAENSVGQRRQVCGADTDRGAKRPCPPDDVTSRQSCTLKRPWRASAVSFANSAWFKWISVAWSPASR